MNNFLETLEENPIIAAIKDNRGLKKALKSDCGLIFILYGDLITIVDIVKKIKTAGKIAFIHVDLLEGTAQKEVVFEYLKRFTEADGIISTKANMIQHAKKWGFFTTHRLFLIDSMSYNNIDKQISISKPDCIEIMPGGMPKVIGWVIEKVSIPVIAGGLVCEKEDVVNALNAGATAISTTNTAIWEM